MREKRSRSKRRWLPARIIHFAAVLTIAAATAPAQMIVLRDATVLVGDGTRRDTASIIITADKITVVASEAPARGRVLDCSGKYVTPGLIDAWSTLMADGGLAGRPASLALDGFDRYDRDARAAAWRQGVTAAFLPAVARDGFGGRGAVVRFGLSRSDDAAVLRSPADLCATIAQASAAGVIARVQSAERLRQRFIDALDYRSALETYEEELEEYLKKLKETGGVEPAPTERRAPAAEPQSRPQEGGPQRRGRRPPRDESDPPAVLFDEETPSESPADGEKKDEEKSDVPKKPTRPDRNLDAEALLAAIDGELHWIVSANRAADVQNALDVAREFNLSLAIESGAGAWRLARALGEARATVVLTPFDQSLEYQASPQREWSSEAIRALHEAGVNLLLASGSRRGDGEPALTLLAAQAVAHGLSEGDALAAITGRAADFLGVSDKVGRVQRGLSADLVIWSDHPFAPGARVERVFVAGQEVYKADGVD